MFSYAEVWHRQGKAVRSDITCHHHTVCEWSATGNRVEHLNWKLTGVTQSVQLFSWYAQVVNAVAKQSTNRSETTCVDNSCVVIKTCRTTLVLFFTKWTGLDHFLYLEWICFQGFSVAPVEKVFVYLPTRRLKEYFCIVVYIKQGRRLAFVCIRKDRAIDSVCVTQDYSVVYIKY